MKPRQLVHRGTVHAAGFWIDESIAGIALTKRRILEMPRVEEVRRMNGGLFVRLRSPSWTATDRAFGVPLVVCRGFLVGAPFDPDELEHLAAPSDSIVLVRGGETVVIAPESCPFEDLAAWIDLSDWIAEPVTSLGVVWTSPIAAPTAKEIDPRKIAGIGPTTKEAEELAVALGTGRPMDSAPSPPGFATSVLTSLSAFLSAMAARLGRTPNRPLNSPTQSQSLVAQAAARAPREDWSDRLRMALNTAAARLLVWARLASWIGRRQADYLEKTLSMFDSGDLDDALRHAIPLGTGSDKPKPLALNVPTPRADLSIHTTQSEASSTLGFGENVYEALRRRYRKAVEQLEKQGRIKEAAFVLAELLGASEEAVSFLEKHGEYKLAAELAEGRNLDPAMVVRQWILAGNRDRAVLIARQTGAFAAAIARLEPAHPEQAAVLRVLWANQLAASGAYGAAVQTIWPVEGARHLARDWIDRGIAIGGAIGARLLATKAWLVPDEFGSVVEIVKALPRDETDEAIDTWKALALSVLANPTSKTMRILARASLRALLGHTNDRDTKSLLDRLATMTEDQVLLADIRRNDSTPNIARKVRLHLCTRSDVGLGRDRNEDGCWAAMVEDSGCTPCAAIDERRLPPRGAIFAVADGMGGFQTSEVVALIFQTISHSVRTADKRPEKAGASLVQAVEDACAAVYNKATQDRKFAGSGATITAAWLVGDVLWIAQVGDTRGYIFRNGILKLVTKDHSLINELVDAGKLTSEEIESFEHKGVITRALGTVERVKVDLYRVQLLDGDRIFLSTDGIHETIEHKRIADALRRPHGETLSGLEFTPKTVCETIKTHVYDAGAHDNLAMVLVDVAIQNGAPVNSQSVEAQLIDTEEDAKAEPEKHTIERGSHDIGTMHVYDAAVLPGGRLLVALGEAGVRMLSPEGKTIVQFDQPATGIVISDHGDRAIVVAQRGETSRMARIDLVKRRAERWFDARLGEFADNFDGSIWFVSNDQGVFAIDALEENFQSIWDLKEPGCVMGARTTNAVIFRIGQEAWTFDLPSLRLRSRCAVPIENGNTWANLTLGPNGTSICCWLEDEAAVTCAPAVHHAPATNWDCLEERASEGVFSLVIMDDAGTLAAFGRVMEGHCLIKVFHLREKKLRLEIRLDGATHMHARFQSSNIILADDRGRVLVVNVERNKLVNEWRI